MRASKEGALRALSKRVWQESKRVRASCSSSSELTAEIRHRVAKLKEETREFGIAAMRESDSNVAAESADVVYQLFIVLALRSVSYRAFRAALISQLDQKRPHRQNTRKRKQAP